jgi:hypothetical protein
VANNAGNRILGLAIVICSLSFCLPAHADVTLSPSSINFGSTTVGLTSSSISLTLTNTGSKRVNITSVSVSSPQFSYVGPLSFALIPAASRTISVSFTPSVAQSYSGLLTFVANHGASFSVALSGTGTPATSTTTPPYITSQPVSRTVTAGQTAAFSVGASGASPFSYQWKKNGTAISGAASSTYTTPPTTTSDSGSQFTVAVTDSTGSVTSGAATLTVNAPSVAPSIVTQPASLTVTAGQTASFSVSASGTSPFTYQWNKNGTAISRATSSAYTTPATATSDSGALFTVTVSNSIGSVTSSAATLIVNAASVAPSIVTQPTSRTVTAGQTASFSVTASGTSPFTYQWNKNGAAISGATSSSYTTPATATTDTGALFTVIVGNSVGSVTSSPATLTVNAATSLLSLNPTSLSFGNVNLGANSTKSATVTNSGTANVSISGVSYSGAGFSTSGLSSGQILAPGQAATINVTFAPTATGSVVGSISIASNATNSPGTLSVSGSGVQVVSHDVVLSWSPSTSTVVGYEVYSSTVSGGPYTKLTSSAVNLTSYTDSTVQSGNTYYYVVTAVNASAVESAYSSQISALIP